MKPDVVAEKVKAGWGRSLERLTDITGGPARRRVVLLLAAVLSLESADAGTVGAVAGQLENTFHMGNTEVGLLLTASSLVGAVAALPMGTLADRSRRVRVLVVTICLWALAMVGTGLATSYLMLLLTRVALGIVIAAAGPFVASLTGDLFPARERSRIYGLILTGELLGGGAGLIASADIGDVFGWRAPFFILAVPSLALAGALHRLLPEPARGGQSWLRPGDEEIKAAEDVEASPSKKGEKSSPRAVGEVTPVPEDSEIRRGARRRKDVEPRPGLVLKRDPTRMTAWQAAGYILRVPSNLVLIGASVLGYFFVAGVRTFAVLFTESHYQVSQAVASLIFIPIGVGAVAGTVAGGRLVDRMIHRGQIDARVLVPGVAFVAAAVAFLPGLASSDLALSVLLFTVAAAFLTAPNPALNAARLDVVPSRLWGRAEAVRTGAQSALQALAPLAFGYLSSVLGGPSANIRSTVNRVRGGAITLAQGRGLAYTFMIMLAPLVAAGALLLVSRMAYLRDVATADLSDTKRWAGVKGAAC